MILQGDQRAKEMPVTILTGNADSDLKRKAFKGEAADLLKGTLKLKRY